MSDYEVIFGLDCVGGDQAPIDCAVVKTSDGKPGIMLDGEVFTKESLTPEPAKIPVIIAPLDTRHTATIAGDGSVAPVTITAGETTYAEDYNIAFVEPGDTVTFTSDGTAGSPGSCVFAVNKDGVVLACANVSRSAPEPLTIPEGTVVVYIGARQE